MNAKALFLFFFFSKLTILCSQDISGYWQGVSYQPTGGSSTYWPMTMELSQNGSIITGTSFYLHPIHTTSYVRFTLVNSSITNYLFHYVESWFGAIQVPPPGGYWCTTQGNLTYDPLTEKLSGTYTSSCGGGTIELWRLKLISDSVFCQGNLINLTVSGQNVKWYSDSILSTQIAAGNNYSPNITSTTTFYITQTHYNSQSPSFPVKIIVKPKSFSTITQSICEGDSFMGYTTNGVYVDTLMNSIGCDSLRTIYLTIKPRIRFKLNHIICEGDTFLGYHSTGIYYDTFTVANNCDSIRMLNLTVSPLIRQKINKRICKGERYFAGGTNQTTAGTYYDTIHSNTGCDTLVETTLTVSPSPKPDLGPDKKICIGDSALLSAGNYPNYLWSNGTTLPTLQIKGPGTFWVSVFTTNGCKSSDTITVQEINCKAIQTPNVFSPNGDGINDTWVIRELQDYPHCQVQIFDRYEKLIFNNISYSKPWDGKYNGKELPIGTYYYVITADNRNYSGSVLIIR